MNPLQQLISDRMADKDWSYTDIERRSRDQAGHARISRARVHQLATTEKLTRVPKFDVVEGLAAGLDLPLRLVWDAAVAAAAEAGLQHLYRERSAEAEFIVAHYEELSPERRRLVRDFVESLRRSRDDAR